MIHFIPQISRLKFPNPVDFHSGNFSTATKILFPILSRSDPVFSLYNAEFEFKVHLFMISETSIREIAVKSLGRLKHAEMIFMNSLEIFETHTMKGITLKEVFINSENQIVFQNISKQNEMQNWDAKAVGSKIADVFISETNNKYEIEFYV